MDRRSVAHALEPLKISSIFLAHAKQAEKEMEQYRASIQWAAAAHACGEIGSEDANLIEAFEHRRRAYAIMFPYRAEFKFRAWVLSEATAETQVELVYGEC